MSSIDVTNSLSSSILNEDNEYLTTSIENYTTNSLQNESRSKGQNSPESFSNNNRTSLISEDGSNKIIKSKNSSTDSQFNDELRDPEDIENSIEFSNENSITDCEDVTEPKFTYDRIGNHFSEIMEKDSATCLTLHERFIAIGTKSGKVYIFDFQGNIVSASFPTTHQNPINAISIDEKGEYIASCSDYQMFITELYTNQNVYVTSFDRPVKAIDIDPAFVNSSFRRFIIGEADRMLFYEKNILGRYKNTCLQQARGVIRRSTWRTHFVAWASDLCVKIYDSTNRSIITHIDRQKSNDYKIKSDTFQCSFCWRDNLTLLIAWGTSIKMCCIKQRTHDSMSSLRSSTSDSLSTLPKFYVELMYAFNIEDNLIACGIAPHENRFLILCIDKQIFIPSIDSIANNEYCRIKMVEPLNADIFNDMSDDILQPKDYLKNILTSRDVTMNYLPEERYYFILCPKDLILAKQRDEDEHINWLMSKGFFNSAMIRVEQNMIKKRYSKHNVETVGSAYIQYLFQTDIFNNLKIAADLLIKVCGNNPKLWEREVMRFKQKDALRLIANILPIGPDVLLDEAFYELVLQEYLQHDSIGYLALIKKWPSNIYSSAHLINATIGVNAQSQDINLQEALAELYTNERQYRQALFIFLQVGNSKKVFDLIYKHNLLYLLEDRIIQLLELDPEETSRLLIINQDTISSEKVITRLQQHPKLLCAYLDRLFHRDPASSAQYHDLMFDLYCTYLPEKVVPLLRQSNHIQLDKALDACKKRQLPNAVVFILGRMGATYEALRIIIDKMNDINFAIEFCREHGDPDLWAELMDISVSNPKLLSTLLQEVSTYASDPIGLITRIPENLEIPNLMQSLIKILHDYRLQVTLENGCCRILRSDCYNLLSKLYKTRSRALVVKQNSFCQSCQRPVLEFDPIYASDVLLFQCGHVFHRQCLIPVSGLETSACTVCRAQISRPNI